MIQVVTVVKLEDEAAWEVEHGGQRFGAVERTTEAFRAWLHGQMIGEYPGLLEAATAVYAFTVPEGIAARPVFRLTTDD